MGMQYVMRVLLVLLLSVQQPLLAEDIDVFARPPGVTGPVPRVLLLVDDAVASEAGIDRLRSALRRVLDGLAMNPDGSARIDVGIMLASDVDAAQGGIESVQLFADIRPFDVAARSALEVRLGSIDRHGEAVRRAHAGLMMAAAYHYLAGRNALHPIAAPPACSKSFVIFIAGAGLEDDEADTRLASRLLEGLGGNTTMIPLVPNGMQHSMADEWARFMQQDSGRMVVHAVDIGAADDGLGPDRSALMKSMAVVSGGRYFASRSPGAQDVAEVLHNAFGDVLAASAVFAPVSLPASTEIPGASINQVFIGMFRPDAYALPRWSGNLKQYRLGKWNDEFRLLDADGSPAIAAEGGAIAACARSYWTPSVVDDYWLHQPRGGCDAVSGSRESNYPDGPVVEKGGQAHVLRGSSVRTVKTCAPDQAACTTLTDFADANPAISKALLGDAMMSDEMRTGMIDWMRGLDTGRHPSDERINGVTGGEMRASVHGDVLHSQPLAINYGSDADPRTVVFYAANDGLLRAVNANRDTAISAPLVATSFAPGEEIWSFVAPEFWPHISRLYRNAVRIAYPGLSAGSAQPKPYAIDGPLTAYRGKINAEEKIFLYAAMRRGGRALYAFDITAADAPRLKWKRGCPTQENDTGCTNDVVNGDWRNIGQTWAGAVPVRVGGYPKPVLLLGGGYAACEDIDDETSGANHDCGTGTKGNRIYIVDADSGALLQSFETRRAVSASLAPVPAANGDDLLAFAYAVDAGGDVYRISGASANQPIADTSPGAWTMTHIASLGCDTVAPCARQRKFLFQVDVVHEGQGFWIMVGSGDRERPLSAHGAGTPRNHFFALRDAPTQPGWLAEESAGDRCGAALLCLASLAQASNDPDAHIDMRGSKGWFLPLASGEGVVTQAITVAGQLVFNTFEVAGLEASACSSSGGESRSYSLRYDSGAAFRPGDGRYRVFADAVLPPMPQAGKVVLDDGQVVPFLIGGGSISPLEASSPVPSDGAGRPGLRAYWHIRK